MSAAILALSLLWALPASAEEVAVEPEATASAETLVGPADVGPAEKIAALSNSDAMALAAKRKRKPAKIVRTPPPARLAALSSHDWNCSGAWCGRQFVLMIGIGY